MATSWRSRVVAAIRPARADEAVAVGGEERRRDQDRRIVAGSRRLDDHGDRRGVAEHESVEQLLGVRGGMGPASRSGADTSLTPADAP